MLQINDNIAIPLHEIVMDAIRAQGAGGQNVNKVSSAVHLRFDIQASSLPEFYKQRLLQLSDHRVTKDGVVVLKAQTYRTQEKNREDALQRLAELIRDATVIQKKRRASKPTRSAKKRRMDSKNKRGKVKALRRKISGPDG